MDPADVLYGARLVEVQHQTAGELLCSAAGHLDSPPRRDVRSLHVALVALGVRGQPGAERVAGAVGVKVHAGEVHQGGFVYVHPQPVLHVHLH